jgi:sugar phosphate isomerase/epimerase
MHHPDLPVTEAREPQRSAFISRRDFLGAASGAAAVAALAAVAPAMGAGRGIRLASAGAGTVTCTGTVAPSKLGIQAWTIVELWEADASQFRRLVASMGYRYVERAFGYGGYASGGSASATPQQLKKVLDDTGLWCCGGHDNGLWPYNDAQFKQTVEGALILGQPYIGANPSYPTTVAGCKQFAETMYRALAVARSMGFKGSLYTHFDTGSMPPLSDDPSKRSINVILESTSPDVWNPELDTQHAQEQIGSVAAVIELVRSYPGRFRMLHMKDGTPPPGPHATPFGLGTWGEADSSNPKQLPHAGFQELLTAEVETQYWDEALLIAETDPPTEGITYAEDYFRGMNGLTFQYSAPTRTGCSPSGATIAPPVHQTAPAKHKAHKKARHKKHRRSRRRRRDARRQGFAG